MSAHAPINNMTEQLDEKIARKELILKLNNLEYKLIILIDNDYLLLKIELLNEIILYSYQIKYDLKTIINILMLNNILYNNFEKIIELINDAYTNKKLLIKDVNKDRIELIIKMPIGFKEYDCSIILKRKNPDINGKFTIIIGKLKKYKDYSNNEIKMLEKYLLDLRSLVDNKLNQNSKLINNLKEKNEKNKKELQKLREEIDILKNEINKSKIEIFNAINNENQEEKLNCIPNIQYSDKDILDNLIKEKKEKDQLINELKKEIEVLKNHQQKNEVKNEKLKIINNREKYNLKYLEFINNKCKKCDKTSMKSIFKCVICDNYYLCEACQKNNSKYKFHEHNEYFHIIYPNGVQAQLGKKENDNIKLNQAINSFYNLLKEIFFDENSNIITKEISNKEIKNLIKICKQMDSLKAPPLEYFSEYQKIYINKELKNDVKLKEIIFQKINIIVNNISKISS